ncbi:hypothetical protein GCM10010273_17340 [Streptomyces lavendulocolor]
MWTRPPAVPISMLRAPAPARHVSPDGGAGLFKIPPAGEGGRRPLASVLTPGQWGDAPQLIPVLERIRIPRPAGGHPRTALITRVATRRTLPAGSAGTCGVHIKHTIPERKDQWANRLWLRS